MQRDSKPSIGLLPKCPQQLGLSQAKAGNWELRVSYLADNHQTTLAITWCLPGSVNWKLESGTGTRNQIQVGALSWDMNILITRLNDLDVQFLNYDSTRFISDSNEFKFEIPHGSTDILAGYMQAKVC